MIEVKSAQQVAPAVKGGATPEGRPQPVFMVGLDGADWETIGRLCAAGKLPHLAKMFAHGASGKLESPADTYAGGVWPEFYTGMTVAEHGIYHNKLWRQQRMRIEVPTDHWLGARPFYEDLSAVGLNVCAIDVPMVLGKPRPLNGVYLGGWGTHDLISKGSWPLSLWDELCESFGEPQMPVESFGAQTPASLLGLREELLDATRQITDIASHLLTRQQPDFTCIVLGAAHRAGHYLWDASQVAEKVSQQERVGIENSLTDIYVNCDRALGQLLEQAPPDAVVIAFAVHGMTTNHGWSDLGAGLVEKILSASLGKAPKRSLLYKLRQNIPFHWVRPILTRLPPWATEKLVRLWSARMYDWSRTPYFPIPMDQAGYVRINLQGRERDGIVSAGEEYEALCRRLEAVFMGLQDKATGQPLVKRVERAWQLAAETAAARDLLPDILIEWGDLQLGTTTTLVCTELPDFRFDVPPRTISGRSGNHVGRGWFVATGSSIRKSELRGFGIRDLAPTVYSLLNLPAPGHFSGRVLPLMAKGAVANDY
jgi:predicted AlkP superfamily phosphohydrolase/phosphomutase